MKILLVLSLITLRLHAQTRLDIAVIDEYLKTQSEFVREVCTPSTEEKYLTLLKEYQGDGNYIPTMLDEKIDLKAVKNIIPLIDEKISWIQTQNEFIKKISDFKDPKKILNDIHELNSNLQDLKKSYYQEKNLEKKKKILEEAKGNFTQLTVLVENFKKSTPYLLSFKFPVNHLGLRTEYEKVKESTDKEGRAKANMIFFFRKIIQDGSYDEENTRSDAMIRAAFDTLYISLFSDKREDENYFLTENERVDLKFVVKNFENLLRNNPEKMAKRFEDWGNRMKRSRDFYQNLLENKKFKLSENSQLKDVTGLLEDRSRALYNLKDFSLTHQAKTYEFWSKKSELFQSLYVLETILYSEVGRSDEFVGFFRQDVAQVVLNRSNDTRFNQLGTNDPLLKYLSKDIDSKKFNWLNVLFKEGEFSFTYFYIPGNLQIYCPDTSRVGKFLRKENLKIGMKLVKNPRKDFLGIRYFSRVSMFGRIAMDTIWRDFKPVGEEPGTEVKRNTKKIKDAYNNGHYRYLYEFEGSNKSLYKVVEVHGTPYVLSSSLDKIYTYRNPHLFKFFSYTK